MTAWGRSAVRIVNSRWRTLYGIWRDPEGRALLLIAAVAVSVATGFYAVVEDLRLLDALYLAVITLATVGYGDVAPATDAGKIFTMVYVMTGTGVLLGFFTLVAQHSAHAFDAERPDGEPPRS